MLRLAYCGAHSRSELSMSRLIDVDETPRETSWWCSAFADRDGRGIVLGFLSAARFTGAIELDRGTCRAYNFAEGISGGPVWSEPLFVAYTDDIPATLQTYADHVARIAGVTNPKPPVSGWASWLHFGVDFDSNTVLENADELARWFEGEEQRPVVHIDHGWEKRVRLHRPDLAWEPRLEFTDDMRALVASINAKNLRTGLWVVPFAINVGAEGAERHLDYVVRDASGAPKLVGAGQNYCIDPTHPEGERWLRELFHRFRKWGVSYFKLEYLRLLLCAEPFDAVDGLDTVRVYARAKTRAEAYRYGLQVIRDAVGPETYLLGCGAPALPGAGLVDAHRVGGDIERWWDSEHRTGVRACSRNAAANFFWNGRAWRNDPDVLAAFDEENLLRFWTTTVMLAGGNALASAPLTRLTETQRHAIRAAMPSLGISAIPHAPNEWRLALDGYELRGFFNPSDEAQTFTIEGEGLLWDFWNDRPIAGTLDVAARDAALVSIRPRASHPQLHGATLHYSMTADTRWDAASRTLTATLTAARRSGSLAFHVPEPFRLVRSSAPVETLDTRTLRVRIGEHGPRSLEMEFANER
jgi:alpha-galactosidase